MLREVGGEFWVNAIPNTPQKEEVPNFLSKFGNVSLTASGRGAITHLLQQIKPKYKTALLPAYICDSVIKPFLKRGYQIYFYDINNDFSPKIDDIRKYDSIGVFLHLGYFGFSTNGNLREIIDEYKMKSTIVIEDITHSLFSNFEMYDRNDYYIVSIRKWLGIPSGGAVISPHVKINEAKLSDDNFSKLRLKALTLKADYMLNGDTKVKEDVNQLFSKAEELLNLDVSPYQIDSLSSKIITEIDVNEIIRKRRRNFSFLEKGLKELTTVKLAFSEIGDDVCPLFLPIIVDEGRDDVRDELIKYNIYCPVHWPISDHINLNLVKNTKSINNRILSIPCDQRYSLDDMNRIIQVLKTIKY